MNFVNRFPRLIATLGLLFASSVPNLAQQQPPQTEDVLRINTELVQTGVTVLDGRGNFVNGLKREQFELIVDGKPQPISFFEQIEAGSDRERQVATRETKDPDRTSSASESYGRTIIFFIDDLHLSLDSLSRTKKMLARFIDNEMGETDRVALASPSGDIGFLQQFTDNKTVLRAAAARLTQKPYNVRDMSRETTPMSEYMALTIERKDDPGVFQFPRAAPGRIQPVDGGFRRALIDLLQPGRQPRDLRQSAYRAQAFETVDPFVAVLAPAHDDWRQLPIALQRPRHGAFRFRHV